VLMIMVSSSLPGVCSSTTLVNLLTSRMITSWWPGVLSVIDAIRSHYAMCARCDCTVGRLSVTGSIQSQPRSSSTVNKLSLDRTIGLSSASSVVLAGFQPLPVANQCGRSFP